MTFQTKILQKFAVFFPASEANGRRPEANSPVSVGGGFSPGAKRLQLFWSS